MDKKKRILKFESEFDAQLSGDLYKATDDTQKKECNNQLKAELNSNPEFANKFSPVQLEQINDGLTPDGYIWHHHQQEGKMQLVDQKIHTGTGHDGGQKIWGGGEEFR